MVTGRVGKVAAGVSLILWASCAFGQHVGQPYQEFFGAPAAGGNGTPKECVIQLTPSSWRLKVQVVITPYFWNNGYTGVGYQNFLGSPYCSDTDGNDAPNLFGKSGTLGGDWAPYAIGVEVRGVGGTIQAVEGYRVWAKHSDVDARFYVDKALRDGSTYLTVNMYTVKTTGNAWSSLDPDVRNFFQNWWDDDAYNPWVGMDGNRDWRVYGDYAAGVAHLFKAVARGQYSFSNLGQIMGKYHEQGCQSCSWIHVQQLAWRPSRIPYIRYCDRDADGWHDLFEERYGYSSVIMYDHPGDRDQDGQLDMHDMDIDGDGIPNVSDNDDDGDGYEDLTDRRAFDPFISGDELPWVAGNGEYRWNFDNWSGPGQPMFWGENAVLTSDIPVAGEGPRVPGEGCMTPPEPSAEELNPYKGTVTDYQIPLNSLTTWYRGKEGGVEGPGISGWIGDSYNDFGVTFQGGYGPTAGEIGGAVGDAVGEKLGEGIEDIFDRLGTMDKSEDNMQIPSGPLASPQGSLWVTPGTGDILKGGFSVSQIAGLAPLTQSAGAVMCLPIPWVDSTVREYCISSYPDTSTTAGQALDVVRQLLRAGMHMLVVWVLFRSVYTVLRQY